MFSGFTYPSFPSNSFPLLSSAKTLYVFLCVVFSPQPKQTQRQLAPEWKLFIYFFLIYSFVHKLPNVARLGVPMSQWLVERSRADMWYWHPEGVGVHISGGGGGRKGE